MFTANVRLKIGKYIICMYMNNEICRAPIRCEINRRIICHDIK